MSEEKPEKNPNSFFNAMSDLLKSVIAFLSESSLLKLLAGKGAISGEKRFWAYFISNGILGYDALAIIVLWRTPPDQFIPALLIISILLIALVFLLFLWNKHETKQKKNSSRSNITIYLMVKDKADQEPLDGAKITGDAVQPIEEFTKKTGRADITIANTSEQIILIVKKEGYRSEHHKLTDEDKEQGHLIIVELQKIERNSTPVKRIQEKTDSASESNSDLNGSQNLETTVSTSNGMKAPHVDLQKKKMAG